MLSALTGACVLQAASLDLQTQRRLDKIPNFKNDITLLGLLPPVPV